MKENMIDDEEDSKPDSLNQMGLHAVRNIIGHPKQLTLFSNQHEKFSKEFGVKLNNEIEGFGIDLNDVQMRVMEGILKGFTETNYRGNISPEDKESIAAEKYDGKLPETYKYVREVPRLRVTQKQIIEWAGLSVESMGEKERALEALHQLGTKQYFFWYDRLAIGKDGEPERDRNGNWKKESVEAVDTLFTVKIVRDEVEAQAARKGEDGNSTEVKKKPGNIKYYEITPSSIFLDQRENYFLLFPFKWREEVQALYGRKRVSAYVYRFLFYLRYQYETKRRNPHVSPPYQIRLSMEELAIALKMPKSVYRGQKERANAILDEAFSVAQKLGYLSDYKRTSAIDVLTLRDEKYLLTQSAAVEKVFKLGNNASSSANYLFDLFHRKKKELNEQHSMPSGQEKEDQLKDLMLLLKSRSPEDVEELIKWGLMQNYWCTRLSTPQKLRSYFDEGWTAMSVTKKQQKKGADPAENRKISQVLEKALRKDRDLIFDVSSKYVEIRRKKDSYPIIVQFDAKSFKSELEHALRKLEVPPNLYQEYLS